MATKLKDSKVIFKEDTHQYFLNGKRRYPSVLP